MLTNGELLNFTKIASDLGASPTTVREHYRILEDTLIGFMVEPYRKKSQRKEISTTKLYLFDIGVCNALRRVRTVEPRTQDFGKAFEHFIALELRAALHYQGINVPLQFWRTHTQQEVDFVIDELLAIEVKGSHKTSLRMVEGLTAFSKIYNVKSRVVISHDPVERIEEGIHFLHYRTFLNNLWAGKYFE